MFVRKNETPTKHAKPTIDSGGPQTQDCLNVRQNQTLKHQNMLFFYLFLFSLLHNIPLQYNMIHIMSHKYNMMIALYPNVL